MERPQGVKFCDECPLAGRAAGEIANCAAVAARTTGKIACIALDGQFQPSRVLRLSDEDGPARFGEQLRGCPGPIKFGPEPTDGRLCSAFDPLPIDDDQDRAMIAQLNGAARQMRRNYIAKNN